MKYESILQCLTDKLYTAYTNTIFSHSGNIGDSREKELIDFLTKVMPHKYGFKSGEVFDDADKSSGQVDVIIYDNLFSTVFTDGTDKIVAPIESTYGMISVKSKMGTKELDNAIEGIERYNVLKRPEAKKGVAQIMPDFAFVAGSNLSISGTIQQNINCIFAFDTVVAEETIQKKVADAGCIDLLVVPGKICIVGRSRLDLNLKKANQPLSNCVIKSDKAVSIFILFLQICLSRNKLIARDLQSLLCWLVDQSNLIT